MGQFSVTILTSTGSVVSDIQHSWRFSSKIVEAGKSQPAEGAKRRFLLNSPVSPSTRLHPALNTSKPIAVLMENALPASAGP